MAEAEVGDDVFGEDPTVVALQERAAELLGKEAALFVASGTMANLCALLAQTRPGDSVILSEGAHPYHYEQANMAVVGGLMPCPVEDAEGKLYPHTIAPRIACLDDAHISPTTLVAIENSTNRGGGACYTADEVTAIAALCRRESMALHCDGARLLHAGAATATDPAALVADCDTVSLCLSKGLGAPVGSVLAGTRAVVHRAHRARKMLGGGMRQAGVLAAAGLHALDHHVADLAHDLRRAREFRAALAGVADFPLPSPTNIVFVTVADAYRVMGELAARGVLVLPTAPDRLRVVFHRDIDDAGLAVALEAFHAVLRDD
jgi:threonine aldolase